MFRCPRLDVGTLRRIVEIHLTFNRRWRADEALIIWLVGNTLTLALSAILLRVVDTGVEQTTIDVARPLGTCLNRLRTKRAA